MTNEEKQTVLGINYFLKTKRIKHRIKEVVIIDDPKLFLLAGYLCPSMSWGTDLRSNFEVGCYMEISSVIVKSIIGEGVYNLAPNYVKDSTSDTLLSGLNRSFRPAALTAFKSIVQKVSSSRTFSRTMGRVRKEIFGSIAVGRHSPLRSFRGSVSGGTDFTVGIPSSGSILGGLYSFRISDDLLNVLPGSLGALGLSSLLKEKFPDLWGELDSIYASIALRFKGRFKPWEVLKSSLKFEFFETPKSARLSLVNGFSSTSPYVIYGSYDRYVNAQYTLFDYGCRFIFLGETCLVQSYPRSVSLDGMGRLHSSGGPAIVFGNGEESYYLEGLPMDKHTIMHPESIDLVTIVTESSIERRRILLQHVGIERFIHPHGPYKLHQETELGQIYVSGDSRLSNFLRVVNGTPNLDGSEKVYWLMVPSGLGVKEVIAQSYGLTAEFYRPIVRT